MDQIAATVAQAGGVLEVSAGQLRDALGAGRNGRRVREWIHEALRRRQLGHLPAALPKRQDETVVLYSLLQPAGQAVGAGLRLAELERTRAGTDR